jgi:hypothetical protein
MDNARRHQNGQQGDGDQTAKGHGTGSLFHHEPGHCGLVLMKCARCEKVALMVDVNVG